MSAPRMNRLLGRYFGLYLLMTIVGGILYLVGGMGPFDATTYAFTTISTGGFANHSGSFTFFDSALLDWMGVHLYAADPASLPAGAQDVKSAPVR